MRLSRGHLGRWIAAAFCLATASCTNTWDSVCQSIGDCAHGGDFSWISTCQDDALALRRQSDASPCAGLFLSYFSCAQAQFQCQGATVSIAGCDSNRADLEQCLAQAQNDNACASYAQAVAACPAADGGSFLPASCSLTQQCEAQCYLSHVPNLCAPDLSSLGDAAQCAQACP